jgi:DNA-binding NtrC family response regulator
MGFVEGVDAPT